MTRTIEMMTKIAEMLDRPEISSIMKPMLDQAVATGRVKTQLEMDEFKQNFVFYIISTNEPLMKIFSNDLAEYVH